jgi:hypothetical protein
MELSRSLLKAEEGIRSNDEGKWFAFRVVKVRVYFSTFDIRHNSEDQDWEDWECLSLHPLTSLSGQHRRDRWKNPENVSSPSTDNGNAQYLISIENPPANLRHLKSSRRILLSSLYPPSDQGSVRNSKDIVMYKNYPSSMSSSSKEWQNTR